MLDPSGSSHRYLSASPSRSVLFAVKLSKSPGTAVQCNPPGPVEMTPSIDGGVFLSTKFSLLLAVDGGLTVSILPTASTLACTVILLVRGTRGRMYWPSVFTYTRGVILLFGSQTRATELMLKSGSLVCTELPSWRVTDPQIVLTFGPMLTRIGTVPTKVSA